MKIMVTGANGQVGQCLIDRLKQTDLIWEAHGRATLDIADEHSVAEQLQRFKPDVLINAAAYTSVDKAEIEPEAASRANIKGPEVLARLCQTQGCALLHISTDYVFSGEAVSPYTPEDSVGPSGLYGLTKLEGERRIQEFCTRHVILRTAWVFSEHGNNFMKTMLRLARERDTLQVVDDQQGTPTYAGHIADALLVIAHRISQSSDSGTYGLYHFGGDKATTWCAFARYIIDQAKQKGLLTRSPVIRGITTDDFPTPAKRPSYSVLSSSLLQQRFGIMPSNWRQAVTDVLFVLAREQTEQLEANSKRFVG
ncbi:dTDP-4-dehydrorhamnose reductase [Pseudomonas duriflava]|uniref:dTDP-4-dehydrorhamnose reductase n=1 Tax=Pseudomonas duriflava TaxID=459528 RepID=A0A562QB12_9PSED|nr:dTDP-4-dehydrorhamnose reductase [Pseudomonas duriflava]TWI53928.1 dTDP-4-dehydrorhamnose reductase [Pseudomonas duriflava]